MSESLEDRYRPLLEQIRDGKLIIPDGLHDRSVFELKLKALRALGYVKGRRGRDLHVTEDGLEFLLLRSFVAIDRARRK